MGSVDFWLSDFGLSTSLRLQTFSVFLLCHLWSFSLVLSLVLLIVMRQLQERKAMTVCSLLIVCAGVVVVVSWEEREIMEHLSSPYKAFSLSD